MVNNSTNINKTKESLNSDGQQFHQYQQNKQSPSLIEHTQKKLKTCDVGNLGPRLEQKQNCGGVKPVNRIPTLPC